MKKQPGTDADPAVQALLQLLHDQAATRPQAELRQPEESAEDVIWNAILLGRQGSFDDMPRAYGIAKLVAGKLAGLGALPEAAMPYAPVVLAGVMHFLWGKQNRFTASPEETSGWAGTLGVAAADVAHRWTKTAGQAWFAPLAEFPRAVDAALKKIEACTYEDVYKHLDPEMAKVQRLANETLARIRASHPDALPGAHAWMMGTLIQKNTFSPLDGSVPEDIGERLAKIHGSLLDQAEGAFMPWLFEGFRAARERPLDEADRWDAGKPAPNRGKRKRAKR